MTHLPSDKLLCHTTFTIGRNCLEKAEAASIQVFCSHHKTIKAANQTCYPDFYLEVFLSLENHKLLSLFDSNKELKKRVDIDSDCFAFDIQVIGKVWGTEE